MKNRIIVTFVIVVLWIAAIQIYNGLQGPIEGSAAVGQLKDDNVTYATSRAIGMGLIPTLIHLFGFLSLVITWVPVLSRKAKESTKGIAIVITFIGLGLALQGCTGPYQQEVLEEIQPNETAYLVPMEGATKDGQGKFMSIEYLDSAKVAAKRITIPTRKRETGRMSGDYEWIPTVRLIKVDRTPITRSWTSASETGTSPTNQAISVESMESIDFWLGVVCQASIREEDASKFLYWYAGKSLSAVMDDNVRGFVQKILFDEFGSRSLTDGKRSKKEIFAMVEKDAKQLFIQRGVTIEYLGGAEGLTYKDSSIQRAINRAFVAENDKKVAAEENLAQVTRNTTLVQRATAERLAAQQFALAKDAMVAKTQLEIQMIQAQASLEFAKRVEGKLPDSIVPQGSGFLYGLDLPRKQK